MQREVTASSNPRLPQSHSPLAKPLLSCVYDFYIPAIGSTSATLNVSRLPKLKGENVNHSTRSVAVSSFIPAKTPSSSHAYPSESLARMGWSPDEEAKIIELRSKGMGWSELSEQLPGRKPDSCRHHYLRNLQHQPDEDLKNKLASIYKMYGKKTWYKTEA